MKSLHNFLVNTKVSNNINEQAFKKFCHVVEILKGCEDTEYVTTRFLNTNPMGGSDEDTFEYKSFLKPLHDLFDFSNWNTYVSYSVNASYNNYAIFVREQRSTSTNFLFTIRYHENAHAEDDYCAFKKFVKQQKMSENDEYVTVEINYDEPELENRFVKVMGEYAVNVNTHNGANVYLINFTKLKQCC